MTSCTGAGGTGTKYTYAQLQGLWINAGGPAAVAPVAGAIALAESGGCSSALNLTDNGGTQTSVGLWQVSNGTHNYPAAWATAAGNATEAVAKYKGAGGAFSPWGTYDSGAYKAFLNGSTTPDTSVPSGGSAAGSNTGVQTDSLLGGCGTSCAWCLQIGGLYSGCVIQRSQARAILGGGLMMAGATTALIGLALVVAATLGRSGALGQAATAAARVPGGGPVASGLQTAHTRATRTGAQAQRQHRARSRQTEGE